MRVSLSSTSASRGRLTRQQLARLPPEWLPAMTEHENPQTPGVGMRHLSTLSIASPAGAAAEAAAAEEFVLRSELCHQLRRLGEFNDEELLIEAANTIDEMHRRLVELDAAPPLDEQPPQRRLRGLFDVGLRLRVTRRAVVLRLTWQ